MKKPVNKDKAQTSEDAKDRKNTPEILVEAPQAEKRKLSLPANVDPEKRKLTPILDVEPEKRKLTPPIDLTPKKVPLDHVTKSVSFKHLPMPAMPKLRAYSDNSENAAKFSPGPVSITAPIMPTSRPDVDKPKHLGTIAGMPGGPRFSVAGLGKLLARTISLEKVSFECSFCSIESIRVQLSILKVHFISVARFRSTAYA